jgi:acyl carrier protein
MTVGDPVLECVGAIVARIAGPSRTPVDLGPDTPLGNGLWLDSIELLEVIVACELEFGIAFDESVDLASGGLETLGALVSLVRARQAELQDPT